MQIENFFGKIALPLSRFAIFLIYFWFGALKVFGTSPANPMVSSLLEKTMPFISFETFIIYFGIFEMIIGILFLIPKLTKVAMVILVAHLGMTAMPLVLLPHIAWQSFLVPTMEGQYMIKNILILSVAISIFALSSEKENN